MNTTFEKLCCGAGATHEMSFLTGVEMGAKPLGSAPAPSVLKIINNFPGHLKLYIGLHNCVFSFTLCTDFCYCR